ncbi:MAG: TRAP transporter small permease [Alphaproteobacteria bacterium]
MSSVDPSIIVPLDAPRRPLVLETERHLKWRALDRLERVLMILCGLMLAGFSIAVFFDVLTRTIGQPWLWLQEVTSAFFMYGVFLGTAVAVRRNDHLLLSAITETMTGRLRVAVEFFNRLVVLGAGLCMVYYGYFNVLDGLGSFRMPSMVPLAYWYIAIPLSGVLIMLFSIEQLVNGCRHGFEGVEPKGGVAEPARDPGGEP